MFEKNFVIIIGAPKSGTSFLFENLSHHPEINASSKKETRFFQNVNLGKKLGSLDEYLQYFDKTDDSKIALEASPGYLYGAPEICDVIDKYLEKPRFLLILREPVKRFQSYYEHLRKRLLIDSRNLNEFAMASIKRFYLLEDKREKLEADYYARCVRAGFYKEYLEKWLKKVGNERMKVVFFDDLRNDSKAMLVDLSDWIGIEKNHYYASNHLGASNESFVFQNESFHKVALWFSQKVSFYLPGSVRGRLRRLYSFFNKGKGEEFNRQSKKELQTLYKYRNEGLCELLESMGYKNLPDWVKKTSER